MQASHCGGFPCGAQTLGAKASVVADCGLWRAGSVVVVHVLSCSRGQTCVPPALVDGFLPTAPPGKSYLMPFDFLPYMVTFTLLSAGSCYIPLNGADFVLACG